MTKKVDQAVETDFAAAADAAQTALDNAIAAEKESREALKESNKNHKLAVKYAKNPPEGEEENAQSLVEGWAADIDAKQAAAEAAKEAVKTAREAAKEAKAALKASEAGRTPKADRVVQNGQTKPADSSKGGQAWAIFDAASTERGSPCAVADVMEQVMGLGMSEGSTRSAYSHWRKFHGIPGGRILPLNAATGMSDEKRAELFEKYSTQLEKARARVEKLEQQLEALGPIGGGEDDSEE